MLSAKICPLFKVCRLLVVSTAMSTNSIAPICVVVNAATLALLKPTTWVLVSATIWSVVKTAT